MRGEGALTVISGSCYGDRSPTFRFRIVLRQLVKEHEESTVQLYIWTLYTWGKKNTNVKPSNQIRQVSRGKNIYIFKEESLSSICHLELHTMVNKMLSMWMMPLCLSSQWLGYAGDNPHVNNHMKPYSLKNPKKKGDRERTGSADRRHKDITLATETISRRVLAPQRTLNQCQDTLAC